MAATRPRPTAAARQPTERVEQAAEAERTERKVVQPFAIGPVKPVGERWLNMMVYGPYGHGKTTYAATAEDVPSMRDVLFINAESGTMSLTGRQSLDTIDINKYDQLARIFEYLTLHCKWRDEGNVDKLLEYEQKLKGPWFEEQRKRLGKPLDEPFLYKTVILDSVSELHKYLIYKFTGVDIGKTKLDEEIERMEEWQSAQEMFRLLVRSFRDLPMNTIFVSAEDIRDPDRKRGQRVGQALPKLAGQMAGDIAGFIDIVGYLQLSRDKEGEDVRRLYLGAGYEGWISKHRFENLPDLEYVDNPTLASLIDLSRKDAERGTSPAHIVPSGNAVSPRRSSPRAAAAQRRSPASGQATGSGARRDNAVRRTGRR